MARPRLADDVALLLDHLAVERAVVGGMSSGSGPAVRFALRHPERTLGLIIQQPVYAGDEVGYASAQSEAFATMDAVASRAGEEGIEVLRPLYYERLPESVREQAWQVASEFDPDSVVATSRFIEVPDLYAEAIPDCTMVPATHGDTIGAIRDFCDAVVAN